MFAAQVYARPQAIDDPALDGYAARGVIVSRDAASLVLAALRRDAFEMRERGGDANLKAAATQEQLADAILASLR